MHHYRGPVGRLLFQVEWRTLLPRYMLGLFSQTLVTSHTDKLASGHRADAQLLQQLSSALDVTLETPRINEMLRFYKVR